MLAAKVIVALSLTLAASSRASPFTSDAYTPIDGAAPLNASHPANDMAVYENLVAAVTKAENKAVDFERLQWFADTYLDGADIEVNFETLQGATYRQRRAKTVAWPGSEWSLYEDGINDRWAGKNTSSPAEKYATAFDLDPVEFANAISASTGVDSLGNTSEPCPVDRKCGILRMIRMHCAVRPGAESGYCTNGGSLSHALALAAIREPEPDCAVQVDDETVFEPMDIEALLTQLYHEAELDVVFFGTRPSTVPSELDKYGRYTDAAQRGINPALLHLILSNILGSRSMPFAIGSMVRNMQSKITHSFNVTKMELIDVTKGARTYFKTKEYPFNKDAAYLVDVETTIMTSQDVFKTPGGIVASGKISSEQYSSKEQLTYLLELDVDKNVIGGEWTKSAIKFHPDFMWIPSPDTTISEDFETEYGLKYADVKELLTKSVGPCK